MRSTFLDPVLATGECFKTKLRLISTLNPKLRSREIIISKDYISKETLVGKPAFELTKYEGKLYEKLLQLNLSRDGVLNKADKRQIINFVNTYGCPVGPINMEAMFVSKDVDINWVFVPYTINTEQGQGTFFNHFRNIYTDFIDTVDAIISNNPIMLKSFEGSFNLGLQGNYLSLRNKDDKTPYRWISNTCFNLCYLELYNLLISQQKLKVCKYCRNIFESSKSNEIRCDECKKLDVYRRARYYLNHEKEKLQSKIRMRRYRIKKKNHLQRSQI